MHFVFPADNLDLSDTGILHWGSSAAHYHFAEIDLPKKTAEPTQRDSFLDYVVEQLSPLGEITVRSLFSGKTLYCNGIVFALIAEKTLFLKADEVNRPAFVQRGLPAFRPFEDQDAVMQYYQAPPEALDDQEAMVRWAGGAVDAGRRSSLKKRPRHKKNIAK